MTPTGRAPDDRPSLQNVPVRTEEGSRIRRTFLTLIGSVTVDYSALELRITDDDRQ
jgi:DNA polymerase-1